MLSIKLLNCTFVKPRMVCLKDATLVSLNFDIEFYMENSQSNSDSEFFEKNEAPTSVASKSTPECLEIDMLRLLQEYESEALKKVSELESKAEERYLSKNQFEYWKEEILAIRREVSGYAGNFNSPLCYDYDDPSEDGLV